MGCTRDFLIQGTTNALIRFQFVEWNPSTEQYDALPITAAFTPPGFAEGLLIKPGGAEVRFPLIDIGLAATGFAGYYTPTGLLDLVGTWQGAGRVLLPNSTALGDDAVYPSLPVEFVVKRSLWNVGTGVVSPDPVPIVVSVPIPSVS